MATVTAPEDGRRQFSGLTVMLANHSMGRDLLSGVDQVGPDAFVVKGSWPPPKPISTFSSSVAASAVEPAAPKSPAQAIWPNLPMGGGR